MVTVGVAMPTAIGSAAQVNVAVPPLAGIVTVELVEVNVNAKIPTLP